VREKLAYMKELKKSKIKMNNAKNQIYKLNHIVPSCASSLLLSGNSLLFLLPTLLCEASPPTLCSLSVLPSEHSLLLAPFVCPKIPLCSCCPLSPSQCSRVYIYITHPPPQRSIPCIYIYIYIYIYGGNSI